MEKALSSEEKPIIENIISLFQQLLSMQSAETEEVMVEEAIAPSGNEEDPDVMKSSEGETGDDKAEHRLEEVTDTTDESLQDLKKSLVDIAKMIQPKKVEKTQAGSDKVVEALGQIQLVLKNVVEQQQSISQNMKAQEDFNKGIMEGIGLGDEVIQKSLPVKNDTKPIQNIDTNEVVKSLLAELLQKTEKEPVNDSANHPFNKKREARKNMGTILEHICSR